MRISEFEPEPVEEAPPTWAVPLLHLSPTSLSRYLRCPEQFRRRYILGEKKRPGEALVLGTAVHKTYEKNFLQKIESHEDLALTELVDSFTDELWPESIAEQEEFGGEIEWDAGNDAARQRGRGMVRTYSTVSKRVQPIAAELKFSVEGITPVPLIGYPDVETDDCIIDMKTAKQARRSVKPDWQLQGRIYSLVRSKPIDFHVIAEKTAITPLEFPDLSIDPSPAATEATVALVQSLAARIERDYLELGPEQVWPTYGSANEMYSGTICRWCGFRPTCPAGGEM